MESLLQLTPWNWRHLNTSVKVDSPVSVDVSLTSQYRLTGKHFSKYLREYLKSSDRLLNFCKIYFSKIFCKVRTQQGFLTEIKLKFFIKNIYKLESCISYRATKTEGLCFCSETDTKHKGKGRCVHYLSGSEDKKVGVLWHDYWRRRLDCKFTISGFLEILSLSSKNQYKNIQFSVHSTCIECFEQR